MSDNINERLAQEARESLAAADLSAQLQQWRDQPPAPQGGGNKRLWLIILLAILGLGIALGWWLTNKNAATQPLPLPAEQSAPGLPEEEQTDPSAPKLVFHPNLALALATYRAPDFTADLRGSTAAGPDALQQARLALSANRPAEAFEALQQAPPEYETDADYLRAHALFRLQKYSQSAVIFGKLRSSVRYGEAAQWYEILAMLPYYERRKAFIMNRLKLIAGDSGHTFQAEAQDLIGKIVQ